MKKQVLTKKEKVMKHLIKHGKISNAQAKARYGVTKLRNVVYSLRKQGFDIKAVQVPSKKGTVSRRQNSYELVK